MNKKKQESLDAANSIKAVIYARYSSSGQREESIEGQIRDCREYAKKNGFLVVGEYIDKALTGRSDKRPDFQRMLKDSERGIFQVVVCWKMDRFARNRYDSATYKYRLKKNGVRVIYAMEAIPEGPEGIILESVMEGYAEYYSENLSQNVKRGYYDSALELKTLGQSVLGYRKGADGRFEIDPETAPIVRRIFEEYSSGKRPKEICEDLNAEGYRTQLGNPFNKNSLPRLIMNEKYTGLYQFKDIRVENGIPPIVSKELFMKCNKILAAHRRAPAAKREINFLLTGKLFCGKCGEPMTGDSGTSHTGKIHSYYICNGRRAHKCDKERIRQEDVERDVVNELVALVHSDDFIEEVADLVLKYQERTKDNSMLNSLESRLKDVEKRIDNLLLAIETGIDTASVKSRMLSLESEKADIEKGIARELIKEPELERDQIIFYLEQFRKGDMESEEWKLSLVEMFLQAVYVYDDNYVITLNYSGSKNKISKKIADKASKGDFSGDLVGSCLSSLGSLNGDNLNHSKRFIFLNRKTFGILVPHMLFIQSQKKTRV